MHDFYFTKNLYTQTDESNFSVTKEISLKYVYKMVIRKLYVSPSGMIFVSRTQVPVYSLGGETATAMPLSWRAVKHVSGSPLRVSSPSQCWGSLGRQYCGEWGKVQPRTVLGGTTLQVHFCCLLKALVSWTDSLPVHWVNCQHTHSACQY